ncbi:porin [Salinarimonas soli]|uniref:Porin n=1 Tax=Salinarimonas soli TaxID=1638099 RepID=A0A5B2VD36_9HYPH|nr:porin [Salinarimonas soli]KAA2236239.1 porin [Salinarimonas soli]
MKLVKSLLLGSAAGLFAVAGAQAADLPVRKAAPVVDYVRVCSAYGAGFFFIPGTETCLRLSGRVRAEYAVAESYRRGLESTFNWRARAQINVDARTQTAYGTLRTFIRYEMTRNTGSIYGNLAGTLNNGNPGANNLVNLDKAFIQFAGITAGRATSFFDFYATSVSWIGAGGSDTGGNDPVVLAYTASFGSGFSATISLEDPSARRNTTAGLLAGAGATTIIYDTDQRPHVVGQLRIDQAWGSAQLSAAGYQIRPSNTFNSFGTTQYVDTEYGFAVQGGLKINLPMLAAGDQLWLQAAYTNGNLNYILPASPQIGGFRLASVADAFIVNGEVERAKGFSLTAAFLHYWTPQIRQGIYANWTQVDVPGGATTISTTGLFGTGAVRDYNQYEIGSNLIWSPVAGLDIGVEVFYRKIAAENGRVQIVETVSPGVTAVTDRFRRSEDQFQTRLRIQRDF